MFFDMNFSVVYRLAYTMWQIVEAHQPYIDLSLTCLAVSIEGCMFRFFK